MIQFKVNELITVKLENDKTVIYVANDRSWHCKYLLLSIPIEQISCFDEIESIDEAAELLDKRLEPEYYEISEDNDNEFIQKELIPPHVEFWANCSNLQVWAENEYNTQLLHSNLAFPLLRKLYFSNDPIAKKVFKKEIAKRLESGFPPVVEFLVLQKYLDYLNEDEFNSVIQNPKVIEALVKAGYKNEEDEYQFDGLYNLILRIKKEKMDYLKTLIEDLLTFDNIPLFNFLERTNIINKSLKKELVYKLLNKDEAKAVEEIRNLITSKDTDFSIDPNNKKVTFFIENRHVVELNLSFCKLNKIPFQITKFKKLRGLCLKGNSLEDLPDFIKVFGDLRYLDVSENKISKISKSICALENLQNLIF